MLKQTYRKIRKKLNTTGGFSLVELLLTTVIMLLVASILARGIPAAQRVYRRTVDVANAQVLLSTAVVVLRDDVGFATELKVGDSEGATSGTTIEFVNPRKGTITLSSKMGESSSEGGSGGTGGANPAGGGTGGSDKTMAQALMISEGLAGNQGYRLEFDSVKVLYDSDALTAKTIKTVAFENLKVVKSEYKEPLAILKEMQIRLINPVQPKPAASETP